MRLDLLFVGRDGSLPAVLPDHDVAFFAASEFDPVMLPFLRRLYACWPRPALNNPALLPLLQRDRLSRLLHGRPGGCYPVLVRPAGSHAGIGFKKIADMEGLASYLLSSFADQFYISTIADYRGADGMFRKYRVAFIDQAPFLRHMAVSGDWMVHYLNAGMTQSADKRAEEAAAMDRFDADSAVRHRTTFAVLNEVLGFDYYSIDCGEMPDGRLLVFKADAAALIHAMDPIEMFTYKHLHMRRVFDAFGAMLRQRAPSVIGTSG